MSAGAASSQKKVRVVLPSRGGNLVFKEDLTAALQSLARQLGMVIQVDGAQTARTDANGDIQIKMGASGAAAAPSQGLDVGTDGKVIAATVMGVMPTIDGTSLDDATPPALTISSSGTRYIVVNVTGTFTLKGTTFVMPTYSAAPTVTITVETTDPSYAGTHNVSTGAFKFLLATFVDGLKTAQNGHGPISAEICDNLGGEAKASLELTWAGP